MEGRTAASEEQRGNVCSNIELYLLKYIEEHPDTQFVIYYPPVSVLNWASALEDGIFEAEWEIILTATKMLTAYDNVRLYAYFDEVSLTCNLDNYKDESHYSPDVNYYIFNDMQSSEEHLLTSGNYERILEADKKIYREYEYTKLFE